MTDYRSSNSASPNVLTTQFEKGSSPCATSLCVSSRRGGAVVFLSRDQLVALRDEISAHLGDASPKPVKLPVGTIVVGNGLTEAQKKHWPNTDTLLAAIAALGQNVTDFRWQDTAEGHAFWASVYRRLVDIKTATEQEKAPPKRSDAGPFSVETKDSVVSVTRDASTTAYLAPDTARALAEVLIRHADEAERRSSN